MPSWIKVHGDKEWYDLGYTSARTNQSFEQLLKKVEKGAISAIEDAVGRWWYLRSDVERLDAAYLKRQAAAKKWHRSGAAIEAKQTSKWHAEMEREQKGRVNRTGSYGPAHLGPVAAHHERAMLKEIAIVNAQRKKTRE